MYAGIYRASAFNQYIKGPHAYNVTWEKVLPQGIYYDALTFFGVKFPPELYQQARSRNRGRRVAAMPASDLDDDGRRRGSAMEHRDPRKTPH